MYECVRRDMYVRLQDQSLEVDVRCPAPFQQGISLKLDLG